MIKRLVLFSLPALVLIVAPAAHAQDLASELAQAEADAAVAQSQISAAQSELAAAQRDLEPVAERAEAASERAEAALSKVETIESELIDQRVDAAEEVAALDADYAAEVEDNDESSELGIGFGIACLVLAAVAFFWTQFRASAPMVWLARQPTLNALAIVGAGVLAGLLVGGALMASEGLARVLGAFLALLALGVGIAALIARHSLRIEHGDGQPLFSRQRFPRWVALVLAVILAVLFVVGLGEGLTGDPEAPEISEETRQLAEAADDDPAEPPTAELEKAQTLAEPVVAKANKLDDALSNAQEAKDEAESQLAAARGRLNQAQRAARQASAKLAAQAAAAEQAAERAAARAARQAEREAEQALSEPPESAGAGCEPGYSPCVPPYPPDVNCAQLSGSVSVTGSDPHGLDADSDGVGCET